MIQVVADTTINQPPEKIFRFMEDFEKDAEWWPGVLAAKRVSEIERGVGARFWQRNSFMGRQFEIYIEVTHYEPFSRISFKSEGGMIPFTGTYLFEPTSGGTKVTMDSQVEATGLFKLLRPLFVYALRSQSKAHFASLKQVVEKTS